MRHVIVPLEGVRPGDTMRLTYSWDCALGWGRLAAETPMSDLQAMARVPQPQPLTLEQLQHCICSPTGTARDSHLHFVALSCGIEPLGPMPCLTAQVPVDTAFGPRPACAIRRGDLLRCLSGGLVPVLQVLRRTVPARGLWRPAQLRSPYLGLQHDVFVSPSQQRGLRQAGQQQRRKQQQVVQAFRRRPKPCPGQIAPRHQIADANQRKNRPDGNDQHWGILPLGPIGRGHIGGLSG